jgi:ribonucleoside-diphosphate reductase alpha chain
MSDSKEGKAQDLASAIGKIKKRDGSVVDFQTVKITNAIYKALVATNRQDYSLAESLAEKVVQRLIKQGFNSSNIPGVEDVQDMVETVLIDEGLADTAKAYILYRHERRRIREEKMKILERTRLDEVDKALSTNALRVLASRYLLRDENGKIVESPKQMFERVAILIAIPDMLRDQRVFASDGGFKQDLSSIESYLDRLDEYDNKYAIGKYKLNKWHFESMLRLYKELALQGKMKVSIDELLNMLANNDFDAYEKRVEEYYSLMVNMYFLPNSPTLMNAGARLGQLSACFVLPIYDDLASIMKTATDCALIFKSGGGVGINYSNLRPEGDIVASTSGVASGPVSFMRIVDTTTEVVKQGGKRRGANMGILEVWHPDIEKFITAKTKPGVLENFNVSVGVWEDFLDAVKSKGKYALKNPRNGKVTRYVDANQLMELIALSAWQSAEPGMLFFDNMNKYNVMKDKQGLLRATNPCVTSDTWIATDDGPRRVKELIGRPFKVYVNGKTYNSSGFFFTGIKKVYRLKTKEGYELRLTEDHRVLTVRKRTRYKIYTEWKAAKDLKRGEEIVLNDCRYYEWDGKYSEYEGYIMGLYIGYGYSNDGMVVLCSWVNDEGVRESVMEAITELVLKHRSDFNYWYKSRGEYRLMLASITDIARELGIDGKRMVTDAIEEASSDFYKGFLRGLFDAYGTVIGDQHKGVSIRLAQSNLELLKAVQRMLLRLGIVSKIYTNGMAGELELFQDGRDGYKYYQTMAQHELVITGENIARFKEVIGFNNMEKKERLNRLLSQYRRRLNKSRFIAEVESLEYDGIEDVYDLHVQEIHSFDANGIIVHNCGEQSLYPYESCNLGSINLARLVKRKADGSYEFDWQKYEQIIRLATRFLDNVIDVSKYPIEEIDRATKLSRRIGLGIMGLADLLYMLRIPYNSKEGYELMNRLAEALSYYSMDESVEIAKQRGSFPLYNESNYVNGMLPVAGYYELPKEEHTHDWNALIAKIKRYGIRNSQTTTVAPTGTLSMIADCSSGLEPLFALVYEKHVTVGKFYYANRIFEEAIRELGIYSDELLASIAENYGSVRGLNEVPEHIQRVFVTAMDIHWADHIVAQAVWQRWISNAIAKTINMPNDVTADDVRCSYLLAHELGLKGITVYRDGSRNQQVLHITSASKAKRFNVTVSDYALEYIRKNVNDTLLLKEIERAILKGLDLDKKHYLQLTSSNISSDSNVSLCPLCKGKVVFMEGCNTCMDCGWSSCIVG